MKLGLYLTLTANGELVLEGNLLGNGRETLVEDTGGPTEFEIDPALELPERVFVLSHQAVMDEYRAGNIKRMIAIEHHLIHQRVVDER